MRLTTTGKVLFFMVGLAILAFTWWTYRDSLPKGLFGGGASTPAAPSGATAAAPGGASTATAKAPGAPAAAERKGVLASIRQTGVMRVGMEPDAPPLHFVNRRKQEDGFDFRLAGVLAESLGAKRVQVVEADYEDLPARLLAGDIDLIIAGYVPDPSVSGVLWSNGYLDFGLCLIVREGMEATYRTARDLAGKRIAIYDDPAAERWVQQNIPGARISKFSGDDGWFEAVERDQADALIYDYPFAAEEIKSHPQTTIVQYNLNQSKYAVAVPAGNFDLVYEVNAAIDRFKATAAYAELMREYLTTSSEIFMRPVAGRRTRTVRAGDTLSRIAQAELGDQARWREIWDLNKDRVANENLIYPRLVLLIPEK
jgi:polar amino acid transport system substrate-binding protein